MRMPFRPKQQMKQLLKKDEPLYMTREGIEKMRRRLKQIEETDLPQAIEDVRRTGEFGDFSENAEYQEAKGRMRRLRNQATTITEKLKVVIEIDQNDSDEGVVVMGSTVELIQDNGTKRTFKLVGPAEADPTKKLLSFKSPLGALLMGRREDEEIRLKSSAGEVVYVITKIQ